MSKATSSYKACPPILGFQIGKMTFSRMVFFLACFSFVVAVVGNNSIISSPAISTRHCYNDKPITDVTVELLAPEPDPFAKDKTHFLLWTRLTCILYFQQMSKFIVNLCVPGVIPTNFKNYVSTISPISMLPISYGPILP